MSGIATWFPLNLWADIAIGAATGIIVAVVATFLTSRRRKADNADQEALSIVLQERQRLLVLCGDALALANLAIQRSLSDDEFLRRLRNQPCYEALAINFSEPLNQLIEATILGQNPRPRLALQLREEILRFQTACEQAQREHKEWASNTSSQSRMFHA